MKKLISIVVIIFALGFSQNTLAFDDIENHWARDSIIKWNDWGVIYGTNNKFHPNYTITRAEFAAIAVRIFNASYQADNTFTDLDEKSWYYKDIRRAVAMGIIYGNGNNTVTPNAPLSREQAVVILSRLFLLKPKGLNTLSDYRDNAQIAPWARDAFAAMADNGYIQGSNGLLRPADIMTRAEAASIFDRMVRSLTINENWISTGDISGNTVISIPDIDIKDTNIVGNLYIADGVGEGRVTIKDTTVSQSITIRGGGVSSVLLDSLRCGGNVNINKTIVPVRVTITSSAQIDGYIVPSTEATIVSNGNNAKIEIPSNLPRNSKITIVGTCDEVSVNSIDSTIIFENATVNKMTLTADSTNNTITLDPLTLVNECSISGSASIAGNGHILSATVDTSGVTMEKMPSSITILSDNTVTINDRDYSGTVETPVSVNSVSINEKGLTSGMTVGSTYQLSATINPYYASGSSITWTSNDTGIATVNSTGLVTAHRYGSVIITAEANEKSDSCVIDIEPAAWDGSSHDYDWYTSVDNGQYVIRTPEDFAGFAAIIEGTAEGIIQDSFSGAVVTLGNNINLNYKDWKPISGVFAGTFDGNGKSIRNLSFHGELAAYSGIFTKVHNGVLNNITVENANITTNGYTGIIAGYAVNTQINSCTVSGTLTGEGHNTCTAGIVEYAKNCSITGCTNNAAISTINGDSILYIAGIVCEANGSTIDGCVNNGRINALYSNNPTNDMYTYAAGIAVYLKNNSKAINCINNGAVSTTGGAYGSAGGIAGLAFEEQPYTIELISDCVNNGNVTATSQDAYAGGIVSELYPGENGITVKNCRNSAIITINSGDSDLTGNIPSVGTIVGWCSDDTRLTLSGNTNTGGVAESGRTSNSNGLYGNFINP